jgi:hypothetical protein
MNGGLLMAARRANGQTPSSPAIRHGHHEGTAPSLLTGTRP